jgi:hypothetical protein
VIFLGKWLPLVGEQLPEVADRMAHDATEYIIKVLPGIDAARLAGLDEAEKKRRGPCAALAACKKPVLPAQAERPEGVFRRVVVGPEPAVAEIAAQGFSLIEGVINGLSSSLRGEGLTSTRPGRRQRFRGTAVFGLYIAASWLLPGRKRVVPYSIQTLKRLKPGLFWQDLIALLDLLQQKKIKPLIAQRFPLAEASRAQEMLGKGGVIGKIVLVPNGSSLESGAA